MNCPLPFTDSLTVLDMLHKVGAEDNVSFYNGKNGRSDFILHLVWHRDFQKGFQRHLSAVSEGKKLVDDDENLTTTQQEEMVTIDQCF
jgi:hypothetical protein